MTDIYKINGYKNRKDYLKSLSEEYEMDYSQVKELADVLVGEEFDGLVSMLEDFRGAF